MENKVTMTFTKEEFSDLSYLVEMAIDEGSTHEDFIALQERLKEEKEKLEEDDEDEVKTAVYFTEEELLDLKRVLDTHIIDRNPHQDYKSLSDKLCKEINNFPMNPVNNDSHDDVAYSMLGSFKRHFGDIVEAHFNPLPRHKDNTTWRCKCTIKPELLENDISLDSKIGKKCSLWEVGDKSNTAEWLSQRGKTYTFQGVINNCYVVGFASEDSEDIPGVYYIPINSAFIKFYKEDL